MRYFRRLFISSFNLMLLTGLLLISPAHASEQDCSSICAEAIKHGISATEINAYEMPDFEQPTIDEDLLNDRWYMQVDGEITIHDAPNGNVIRSLDAGFNFITALAEQDGWVQINAGEWVNASALSTSNRVISQFTGIILDGEFPEYPVAWVLVNAYPSETPGGPPIETRDMIYRYTLVNIFSTVEIDGWRWYQIGPDAWIQQMNVSKVLPAERPDEVETDRWVSIDLYEQVLTAYEGDQPVFATLVSTGLPRWPTYEGVFNIYFRQTRRNMSWGTPGDDFYFLEEVPWTMFFDEGRALHGAYWHDGLGYRRSHGCVNLSITDAHWLYHWVAEVSETLVSRDVEPEGPAVYVWSSDAYR
ncbi:MAG: L,D-transpeptidase [Chloroflexota bacterium]